MKALAKRINEKLAPQSFLPFKILGMVGPVAYKGRQVLPEKLFPRSNSTCKEYHGGPIGGHTGSCQLTGKLPRTCKGQG